MLNWHIRNILKMCSTICFQLPILALLTVCSIVPYYMCRCVQSTIIIDFICKCVLVSILMLYGSSVYCFSIIYMFLWYRPTVCVCVCVFVCEQHLTCYKFDSGKTIFNPIHHCLSDSGKMSENWLFCLYNGIRGMNTGIEIQRKKKKSTTSWK